ncbi:COX15/CtaA family protein [soil metagenome]
MNEVKTVSVKTPEQRLRRFQNFLSVLAVLIFGLMALGAGVRTMNAGLSCPDWPLCFGKVIPDFHPAVWFEFVHRAYAGVVGLGYVAALVIAWRSKIVPSSTKTAAKIGILFLVFQIFLGRQTVTMQLKPYIVTSHLLLATLFLVCVLWMLYGVRRELLAREAFQTGAAPAGLRWLQYFLPVIVFVQIAIGGLVASTYAGMICVDWPYCNGQWVPTWAGPMGLQIIHRFVAYGLVVLFVALAFVARAKRRVMSANLKRMFYAAGVVVLLQTFVGIMNLILFIPPHVTVLHQTLAMILLAVSLKISFELRHAVPVVRGEVTSSENLVAGTATLS